MPKCSRDSELAPPPSKKQITSRDYVYYMAARKGAKVYKVAPTKIGKRPIYKFFIDVEGKYFPLRCMLDLGSTSFVISLEATKAFKIPVIKRVIPARASDVRGSTITTEGLFTIPLG
jgi:hypothetical protein